MPSSVIHVDPVNRLIANEKLMSAFLLAVNYNAAFLSKQVVRQYEWLGSLLFNLPWVNVQNCQVLLCFHEVEGPVPAQSFNG